MKRKFISYCLFISCVIFIAGCGRTEVDLENSKVNEVVENNDKETSDGTLKESDIKVDIQNEDLFVSQGLTITNFEVIKRQTNIDNKEDIVYVHVEGENADFAVVRNYKLLYVLYNEGWMLDGTEPYSDEEYSDSTIPLHGVTDEIVNAYFEDFTYYNPNEYFHSQIQNVVYGNIEKIVSDTYYEVYQQINVYEYPLFKEEITTTISFSLKDFSWEAYVDTASVPYLKDTTMGQWHSDVVVGWDLRSGLYEGGNEATGTIDVFLSNINKTQYTCGINTDIRTGYGNDVGCLSDEDVSKLEYIYDKDNSIVGILVCSPYQGSETEVLITLDGLVYDDEGIQWVLRKVS